MMTSCFLSLLISQPPKHLLQESLKHNMLTQMVKPNYHGPAASSALLFLQNIKTISDAKARQKD